MDRRDVLRYLGLYAARPYVPAPWFRDQTAIPFVLHGRHGQVAVSYGVTEDPVRSGFDIIPGLRFDAKACRGYPTMHATIERFEGEGYRTICGWIQVVTGVRSGGGKPSETAVSVDILPAMSDVPSPWASMGNLPQMFDAPCRNLNGYDQLHWIADTFLTTVPVRTRDEPIERLLGFRWGYDEYADPARPPIRLPFAVTGADAWNALIPRMQKDYPSWRFASA